MSFHSDNIVLIHGGLVMPYDIISYPLFAEAEMQHHNTMCSRRPNMVLHC